MPLFQPEYVSSHWNVMTTWNFNFIKARCYKAPNHDADAVPNEVDGDDQGGDDNDDERVKNNSDLPATRAVGIDGGPSSSTAGVSNDGGPSLMVVLERLSTQALKRSSTQALKHSSTQALPNH